VDDFDISNIYLTSQLIVTFCESCDDSKGLVKVYDKKSFTLLTEIAGSDNDVTLLPSIKIV
jgi:hypothetical protein